jgi:hypothetical protein
VCKSRFSQTISAGMQSNIPGPEGNDESIHVLGLSVCLEKTAFTGHFGIFSDLKESGRGIVKLDIVCVFEALALHVNHS